MVQRLRLQASNAGVWVQSLVRELRSHMLCSVVKLKKKQTKKKQLMGTLKAWSVAQKTIGTIFRGFAKVSLREVPGRPTWTQIQIAILGVTTSPYSLSPKPRVT